MIENICTKITQQGRTFKFQDQWRHVCCLIISNYRLGNTPTYTHISPLVHMTTIGLAVSMLQLLNAKLPLYTLNIT